jgi:long-chain acyl-CoA synthetase
MDKPWYQHYDEGIPTSIDYPSIPLDHFLSKSATNHPERTATIFGSRVGSRIMDSSISYEELNHIVNRFAAGLQEMGVKKGDCVALMLPNNPQFVIAAYATWRIGGIVVCCNPLYVAREIKHLINDSGSETIIVMSSLYKRVKGIRAETDLKRVIVTNIKEYFPGLLKFLFSLSKEKKEGHRINITGDENTFWFQDIIKKAPHNPKPVDITTEDIATLIYTGGTTGIPKGAQLTHYNLVSNATVLNLWAKSQEAKEIMLAVMPFFHIYGLTASMNTPIANANTILLIPNPRDMAHVLASIEKHRATYYPGVPTMFVGFNNFPERKKYDLTSLRFAVSAAAPLPPEVQERFETITGGKMVEAYGLTETSPAVSMDPIDKPKAHSIGIPLPDVDIKIVDIETGTQELEVGEVGEIIINGPPVMKGYWNMPTETRNALRVGPDGLPGWFHSGDMGYMDRDGYFHIVDRKKDMIIAGGFNIYPAEVEAVLYEHPKIQEAAVIGVPDPKRGETVKAYIVLKENETASENEILTYCREQLAAYKVPKIVEFRSDLPKSMIGKILRRELREES